MSSKNFSRRDFLSGAVAMGVTGAIGSGVVSSCTPAESSKSFYSYKTRDLNFPPLLDIAPEGIELKAGVIGCGGRGSGAAINFLDAGPGLSIVALGDVFQDRVDSLKEKLINQKGVEVADENCFVGFDAFEKVIEAGVDIVILACPPKFRAKHFEAAVKARKHVFLEKPIAVDPVGVRSVISTAKMAESLGLKIVSGTHKRHEKSFVKLLQRVNEDAIGEIISANIYFNMQQLWYRNRNAEWSEMEWMIRDWVNWCWLSGDHIVEQHVHNIDIANWFFGTHPIKALGFGSRQKRATGDQYDNFSVDYTFDDGRQMHSMCRQINGTDGKVSDIFHGTKGIATTDNWDSPKILDLQGNIIETIEKAKIGGHAQEHIDLVTCIRKNIPRNEAEQTAISNMVAIMGRVSAYTGKEVTFDEMLNSDMKLGPDIFVMGDVGIIENAKVPVPGKLDG
ncbi:MAG: Gfo/Idh/MocA family oxidoreductase [Prolixibacteraceae bacterium]|jgi:myo-inositol 2-dehydrogenase / D-chiro-inositol 1-dehydrogenase|nr:Gfo/Idh/MocA family oxidoreductase [Prolixibacteraceae bacterium]MBT6998104.1 Gfo/Idh/MocA family oxidoreductase [Prolixibacteraceae bacterium]MBT7394622.1 Gfo/Idh/MocA family oxidoreductase [Prolixibacteraceae bacterium]